MLLHFCGALAFVGGVSAKLAVTYCWLLFSFNFLTTHQYLRENLLIMRRILSVRQIKPIQINENGFVYPLNCCTKIELDKKSPSNKKEHQIVYQQGRQYGSVGDCCTSVNNDELFELEAKGMIKITTIGNP